MVRRPDLGYHDEGMDLGDPRSYEAACRAFGKASMLPRLAYRSLQFLYLEDEAIWTREWIPVGTVHEIPGTGDLLPFTLGYHGVHVQNQGEGQYEARFNMAQHGGCRTVPVQCQQGTRTSCSFTSCGYSRDRGPIRPDQTGGAARDMYQYMGLRPERLQKVQLARTRSLLCLNIDPGSAALDLDLPAQFSPPAASVHRQWTELQANWKLAGQSLAHVGGIDACDDRRMQGQRRSANGDWLTVCWIFPNLVLLSGRDECCLIVLQHTAITKTQLRIEILSDRPLSAARLAFWQAEIATSGMIAETAQKAIPKNPALDALPGRGAERPLQTDPAGWWLQCQLAARFANLPKLDSNIPIFSKAEHYLT